MGILVCAGLSCLVAELLGYWLHRVLHSGRIPTLSRPHMAHHLVLYGPRQSQRPSERYKDATTGHIALGNIGLEWLAPSGILLGISLALFWLLGVRALYQAIYVLVVLAWSFAVFSYLHDRMHEKDSWMASNRWTRRWFLPRAGFTTCTIEPSMTAERCTRISASDSFSSIAYLALLRFSKDRSITRAMQRPGGAMVLAFQTRSLNRVADTPVRCL